MSTSVTTDPPGRLSDYAHAALLLGQVKDALRAAQVATDPGVAVQKLQDAQWFCERFRKLVDALGPEADELDSMLFISFSSADHPSRDGFIEAITASGASRTEAIIGLKRDVRDCLRELRTAKNAVAFPRGSATPPAPSP